MRPRSVLPAGLVFSLCLTLACRDAPPAGPVALHALDAAIAPATTLVVSRLDLGTLGGRSSYAADVNHDGTVVGWSQNANGTSRAFRWTRAGGMVDLGALPGDEWSRAVSITDDGRVLGVSGAGAGYAGTPVLWSPAGAIDAVPIPLSAGAAFGAPSDVNEQGEVVGWDLLALQHAWAWSEPRGKYDITANVPGGSQEGVASAINAAGLVVGTNKAGVCTTVPECWHAFVWSLDGGYRDLGTPGDDPNTTVAGLGLNDVDAVVGWVSVGGFGVLPYRWCAAFGFTLLPALSYGYAIAIDAGGTAVGASWDPTHDAIQAVAWPAAGGFIKLSPDDPNPQVAVAINDAGAVAGWSSMDGGHGENHATLWTLGAGGSVVAGATPRPTGTPPALADAPGTVACLSDTRALVSRDALFACLVESEAIP